ncbi:hypothetical protein P154DRAFT_520082 [Amniculicola lignicola CBS 123094]|uniref:Uncharacterized protein n=1 Tax=Amniculicola lignicola CBS 123094 TaxID=1392246 RepID=A0A6A5WWK5_9PLEO|nr:hypothetical protein P154DRAFT_520082 [Amniculicola lignicola CBS 123094]
MPPWARKNPPPSEGAESRDAPADSTRSSRKAGALKPTLKKATATKATRSLKPTTTKSAAKPPAKKPSKKLLAAIKAIVIEPLSDDEDDEVEQPAAKKPVAVPAASPITIQINKKPTPGDSENTDNTFFGVKDIEKKIIGLIDSPGSGIDVYLIDFSFSEFFRLMDLIDREVSQSHYPVDEVELRVEVNVDCEMVKKVFRTPSNQAFNDPSSDLPDAGTPSLSHYENHLYKNNTALTHKNNLQIQVEKSVSVANYKDRIHKQWECEIHKYRNFGFWCWVSSGGAHYKLEPIIANASDSHILSKLIDTVKAGHNQLKPSLPHPPAAGTPKKAIPVLSSSPINPGGDSYVTMENFENQMYKIAVQGFKLKDGIATLQGAAHLLELSSIGRS